MRGFEPGEFAARTQKLQTAMAAEGLDAILVTTEADLRYITGFEDRPPVRTVQNAAQATKPTRQSDERARVERPMLHAELQAVEEARP